MSVSTEKQFRFVGPWYSESKTLYRIIDETGDMFVTVFIDQQWKAVRRDGTLFTFRVKEINLITQKVAAVDNDDYSLTLDAMFFLADSTRPISLMS